LELLNKEAKETRLFKSSDELPKSTISQIRDLNDLPSKEPFGMDEPINIGLKF